MANVLLSTREPGINPIYTTNAFLSEYKEKLQNVLSDLTNVKMNGNGNVEACRNICTNMCLPKQFVVDTDFRKRKINVTDCFVWQSGAIEEMILSMRDSSMDEQLKHIFKDLK